MDDPELREVVVSAHRYHERGKREKDLILLAERLANLDDAKRAEAMRILNSLPTP